MLEKWAQQPPGVSLLSSTPHPRSSCHSRTVARTIFRPYARLGLREPLAQDGDEALLVRRPLPGDEHPRSLLRRVPLVADVNAPGRSAGRDLELATGTEVRASAGTEVLHLGAREDDPDETDDSARSSSPQPAVQCVEKEGQGGDQR